MVHLPHLVDGAVPSDMALGSPAGLAEERRLFYVAVTRARDQLFLYAPLRLHHHRLASDDRHSYGQLSRFLDGSALAACESVRPSRRSRCCPAPGGWPRGSTRISVRCGQADQRDRRSRATRDQATVAQGGRAAAPRATWKSPGEDGRWPRSGRTRHGS